MDEFSLIEKYFKPLGEVDLGNQSTSPNVVMGIGDDCALLASRPGYELAVTLDTLVAGVHFLEDVDSLDLGYKALAVNLSDLAAMGAEPAWFTMGLSLPDHKDQWLQGFSQGLSVLSKAHKIPLVGGDTTKGPLTISIQVAGWVPQGQAIRRSGAQAGDILFVTGELGWPYLGLKSIQQKLNLSEQDKIIAQQKLLRPEPLIDFAQTVREYVHAGIDVSDGLSADLNHILKASNVGAQLDFAKLPIAAPLTLGFAEHLYDAVNFGDEYQLLLTVPASQQQKIESFAKEANVGITAIGQITSGNQLVDENGKTVTAQGYKHF